LGTFVRSWYLGSVVVVTLIGCVPAVARAAAPPAFTSPPVVQGDTVLGSTLQVVGATWTGDPAPSVRYHWARCPADVIVCKAIKDAVEAQYVVTGADVGFRLAAQVDLKNTAGTATATTAPTAVITTVPTPAPAPPPPGAPPPSGSAPPPAPASPPPLDVPSPVTTVAAASAVPVAPFVKMAARPTLMRPFPVVRIRGVAQARGSRITLLAVRGPRAARIDARCLGPGCPVPGLSLPAAPARLRPFERFLPAGTVLQIRVTRAGRIGKYASVLIRANRAPLRSDRCLMPGGSKPTACPAS
jgi:hypothetical protein